MNVLALDPGQKVGWARAAVADDGSISDLRHGITEWKPMALRLGDVMHEYDVVIYETWRLRPDKAMQMIGSTFPEVQFIGVVRYLAWLYPQQITVYAQGADLQKTGRKVLIPELKEVMDRMPKTHDDAHDGSAILHLSYWLWDRFA